MLFDIFKRSKPKNTPAADFAFLGTDMHSHLVPAVDDGSDSEETSLQLLQGFVEMGYKRVITTPHIRPDYFPNTKETLANGFKRLETALAKSALPITVGYAAEYFVDFDFPKVMEAGELLTFSGNHVLIEFSTFSAPPNLFDIIFQLRLKGYQPIVAHPERYIYFQGLGEFEKLKDFGCYLQLNILSLMGHYGKPTKELALKLLKGNLADFLGTDMHHSRHLDTLKNACYDHKLMDQLGAYDFRNASLA